MPPLTILKKEDFNKILNKYSLGKHKSHKHLDWALANTVYLLKTTKSKYILKVCEQSKEDLLKFQIKIIDYLDEKNLLVAKIIKSNTNREIIHYNKKPIIIQKFVEGKHPRKIDEDLMKDIANLFGLMHKHLLKLKLQGKHTWRNHFKPSPDKIGTISGVNFKTEEQNLIKQLQKIDKNKLRKCIIHSDLRDINLLVKNNKVKAILDWDDAHEDYLSYDIGVFLLDPSVKNGRVNKKAIKLFFQEYQKHTKLTKEEKEAVYYFIKVRLLSTIAWFSKQTQIHKEHANRLKKSQSRMIKKYQIFNNFTVEEFLELC